MDQVLAVYLAILYTDLAMYVMTDLQKILGFTRRQVRERLDALASVDHILDGQVKKGPRGRKEYTSAVLEMLRDLDALATNLDLPLRQAAKEVGTRIRGTSQEGPPSNVADVDGRGGQVKGQVIGEEVVSLRTQVQHLNRENERLWQQVDRLTRMLGEAQAQLALPSPKPRRRWWPFSRWRLGTDAGHS